MGGGYGNTWYRGSAGAGTTTPLIPPALPPPPWGSGRGRVLHGGAPPPGRWGALQLRSRPAPRPRRGAVFACGHGDGPMGRRGGARRAQRANGQAGRGREGRDGRGQPIGRRGVAAPGESSRRAGTERAPAPPQPEPRAAAAAMRLRGARPPPGKRGRAASPAPRTGPPPGPRPGHSPPHLRPRPVPGIGGFTLRSGAGWDRGRLPAAFPGRAGTPVAGCWAGPERPIPPRPVTGCFPRAGPELPPGAAAPGPDLRPLRALLSRPVRAPRAPPRPAAPNGETGRDGAAAALRLRRGSPGAPAGGGGRAPRWAGWEPLARTGLVSLSLGWPFRPRGPCHPRAPVQPGVVSATCRRERSRGRGRAQPRGRAPCSPRASILRPPQPCPFLGTGSRWAQAPRPLPRFALGAPSPP